MLRRSFVWSDCTTHIKRFAKPLRTHCHGADVLHDPLWNKALAFDHSERDRLGLRGLLPPAVRTLEQQLSNCLRQIRSQPTPEAKNIYLTDLHHRNETLYHRVLVDYIEEMAPLVYTPTVGVVCQQYGHQFRRPRGMFFSTDDIGHFSTMVYNWPHDDAHVIVVTDGSRILGLGDLGAQGMGIPVGKLALYCAAGGIAPHRVLPVTLDVGTDNEKLLQDPNYIGVRHRRLTGEAYYNFVDEFMNAIYQRFPNACVQFEDFQTSCAVPLLAKYRDHFPCFNDDIQGTGAVTAASLFSAERLIGVALKDMRLLIVGAGSAGQGVAEAVRSSKRGEGAAEVQIAADIALMTNKGVIGAKGGTHGDPHYCPTSGAMSDALLRPWAHGTIPDGTPLVEAIRAHKPHVLIGLSACGGIFSEAVVREMAAHQSRPVIMPLSNPTSKAECTAEQAFRWTDGRALVATGSPFDPVTIDGKTYVSSQCNNMYIFPGLGLANSVSGLKRFTDVMFHEASKACAASLTESEIAEGRLFPCLKRIRDVSVKVAEAVIKEGIKERLTPKIKKQHIAEGVERLIRRKMYFPSYSPLISSKDTN